MRRNVLLLASGFWLLAFAAGPAAAQQAPAPQPDTAIVAQARPAQTPPARPGTPAPPPPGQPGAAPLQPMPPAAPMQPAPPMPLEPLPTQNVKVDLTITDTFGSGLKKTVSMLVAAGRNGRVRSQNGSFVLNVDSRPDVLGDGRIIINLTLEYRPQGDQPSAENASVVTESLSVLLADGKPTMISQSADPRTDRQVTVEVTATAVK